MPEFIADTDGSVIGNQWSDLSPFLQGYIEAMLFTETSAIAMVEWEEPESQERIREGTADGTIPHDAGFGDLYPESFIQAMTDCADFQIAAEALLAEAYEREYDDAQAGRDFWYTRNGHGVGYWGRRALEDGDLGDRLTKACKAFGELYVDFIPYDSSPTGYGYIHLG